MWFTFAVLALLCWSGADLFSKLGCQGEDDNYSHLKMVTAVGMVMGLHAGYSIFFCGVDVSWYVISAYLPVSALYILSMAIGYLGMRYIELSILSPVCNSSGAIVAVLLLVTAGPDESVPAMGLIAIALVCIGTIGLGITEENEDEELRRKRQERSNRRYAKSWLALGIPIIYCILDAVGTFADSRILLTLDEDSANTAYELTFFAVGIVSAVYVLAVRRQKLILKEEKPKYIGAVLETAGQFFYIYALADEKHAMFSAPMISAYCVGSVLWGRVFLKEKLSKQHYMSIACVSAGIVLLGILDL